MMSAESWVFRVVPHSDESFGHFMGRFRRANALSHKAIAEHLCIRVEWVQAWDTPSRRRNPTPLQLIALSRLTDVESQQLERMLPPDSLHLQTRLCPDCYAEVPVHRSTWQQATVDQCTRHSVHLLSACSECGFSFRTPALWQDDRCDHCGLLFARMQCKPKLQQKLSNPPKSNRNRLSKSQE